jgi:hypothetical protein
VEVQRGSTQDLIGEDDGERTQRGRCGYHVGEDQLAFESIQKVAREVFGGGTMLYLEIFWKSYLLLSSLLLYIHIHRPHE